MDQPLISIIIPATRRALDRAAWILSPARLILPESLSCRTDRRTDRQDVRQFVSRIGVRYVRQETRVSAARNRACQPGKWVCFVDADDYVNRDHVHTMVSALASRN